MLLWSMALFIQVKEANIVFVLLDLVADCLIVRNFLGHAHAWLGRAKSQAGEELDAVLLLISLLVVAHPIQLKSFSLELSPQKQS